jgi:acyl-CoA synthetase (AMP-forming)/AMP-acid ligase II
VLTHLNLIHSVLHYRHGLACARASAPCWPCRLARDGLVALILAMAGVGGSVVLLADFKAAAALALVARERVTYTLMVPAMYALWLREPALRDRSLLAAAGGLRRRADGERHHRRPAGQLPGHPPVQRLWFHRTASPATMTPPGSDVLERSASRCPAPTSA